MPLWNAEALTAGCFQAALTWKALPKTLNKRLQETQQDITSVFMCYLLTCKTLKTADTMKRVLLEKKGISRITCHHHKGWYEDKDKVGASH